MKITLLSDDAIRLEPTPGALTVEAASAEMSYSPFHMLASALATCTFSVMHSWATHKKVSADDLTIEVQWIFGDDPHRVSDLGVIFDWPSLPADRIQTAKRVAALCTIHATLMHPPQINILAASEAGHAHHDHDHAHDGEPMHDEPAAAPTVTSNTSGAP